MVVLCRLWSIRPSVILKSSKSLCLTIALIILIVMCFCIITYWQCCVETEQIDMIYAMYEELRRLPDFDALIYKDGNLFTVDYDNDIRIYQTTFWGSIQ
jgi:hypothetical protein